MTVIPMKFYARKKYFTLAQQEMHRAPLCYHAVVNGWGLGMYEFLLHKGRLPNDSEQKELINSNKTFWKEYKNMQSSNNPMPGIVGMFDHLIQKRQDIVRTYGPQ